jgi:hypothetical protein
MTVCFEAGQKLWLFKQYSISSKTVKAIHDSTLLCGTSSIVTFFTPFYIILPPPRVLLLLLTIKCLGSWKTQSIHQFTIT